LSTVPEFSFDLKGMLAMRTFLGLVLLALAAPQFTLRAGDEIREELRVDIPVGTKFITNPSPEGVSWEVDMDLAAKVFYSGMMGEAADSFVSKMTLNSVTTSKTLTYTDGSTGQTASAPRVFRSGDGGDVTVSVR
jgi:hypothetical protein